MLFKTLGVGGIDGWREENALWEVDKNVGHLCHTQTTINENVIVERVLVTRPNLLFQYFISCLGGLGGEAKSVRPASLSVRASIALSSNTIRGAPRTRLNVSLACAPLLYNDKLLQFYSDSFQ